MYFKIYVEKFPSIKYEEILNEMDINYPNINKILFIKKNFYNLRNEIYGEAYDEMNKYELIDIINYNGTKLLKEKIQYSKENEENVTIRIFCTSEALS